MMQGMEDMIGCLFDKMAPIRKLCAPGCQPLMGVFGDDSKDSWEKNDSGEDQGQRLTQQEFCAVKYQEEQQDMDAMCNADCDVMGIMGELQALGEGEDEIMAV